MKQSSVLSHGKVKKSQRFVRCCFLSHSSIVHNLDRDRGKRTHHGAFTLRFAVCVRCERRYGGRGGICSSCGLSKIV